jgi:hypothetical protein
MHYCVEALEIRPCQVADIFANLRNLRRPVSKVTTFKQVSIKAKHVMTGGTQDGACHGADIPLMASQQNSHVNSRSK